MTRRTPVPIDAALCQALAARAQTGDEAAWHALIDHLWPPLGHVVRSELPKSWLDRAEDHVADVLSRVLERLRPARGPSQAPRGLALFPPWQQRHPEKTFKDWILIITVNETRRHLGKQTSDPAGVDRAPEDDPGGQLEPLPSVKRFLNELARPGVIAKLGARPPITNMQTARQILEFARAHLPEAQVQALRSWMHGASFDEIAGELGLGDASAAQKLVRAAQAALRRHFADGGA